jgi:5-methylcytosine-specific restriction protein B
VLRHYHAGTDFPIDNLIRLLHRVNAAIGDPHYALGISYFLRPTLARDLPDIWQMEIEPYLEEIFFDQPEEMEALRWSAVGKLLSRKPAREASST